MTEMPHSCIWSHKQKAPAMDAPLRETGHLHSTAPVASATSPSSAPPTAASTEAASSAAAATWTISLRTCLVHREITAAQVRSIERLHRLAGSIIVYHFDKSESARLPCIAVRNNADLIDRTVGFKQTAYLIF